MGFSDQGFRGLGFWGFLLGFRWFTTVWGLGFRDSGGLGIRVQGFRGLVFWIFWGVKGCMMVWGL